MPSEWGMAGTGAASGAASGAATGTQIMPGYGTAIGAGVGAIVGGASGYLGGRGVGKRQRAQDEAEQAMRAAVTNYQGRQTEEGNIRSRFGAEAENEYQQAQLGEMSNRTAMARNAGADMQNAYARALQGAQGVMGTAQSQIPEAQLRSAAQQAYARNMANTAQGRALNAQLPGAYTQALQQMGQARANLGQDTQLKHGVLHQQAGQFGNLQAIRGAEIDRDFAAAMGAAQNQMAKANSAGSEQMMYGAMLNAGLNLANSGAGMYKQSGLQAQNQAQNKQLHDQMMQYYQTPQQYQQPRQYQQPMYNYDDGTL